MIRKVQDNAKAMHFHLDVIQWIIHKLNKYNFTKWVHISWDIRWGTQIKRECWYCLIQNSEQILSFMICWKCCTFTHTLWNSMTISSWCSHIIIIKCNIRMNTIISSIQWFYKFLLNVQFCDVKCFLYHECSKMYCISIVSIIFLVKMFWVCFLNW